MASDHPSTTSAAADSRDPTDYIVPEDDNEVEKGPVFLDDASENGSSTNSLSSSIMNYQYENGRRYHAYREGKYIAPNDDREQDRMDLNHHIYRLTVGGALFRAPVGPKPGRILDIGTGTGIWAIEMADEFPDSAVIGTDLSPIQPRWVPPNCYFEVDDYESEWDFSRPFDFIHGRGLVGTISSGNAFMEQALKNLRPGGWLELVDMTPEPFSDDGTVQNAPNVAEWCRLSDEASIKFGKRLNIPHLYRSWMQDAGFKNIREDVYKVPTSSWAKDPKMKELGAYQQANMLEGMETYTLALLTRAFGWSADEVRTFLVGVREEIMNRKLHVYCKVYFVYGRKE